MITFEEAKKIGIDACVEKIGNTLVETNKERATFGCGQHGEAVFCFVGVDTENRDLSQGLLLDSTSKFPYMASCNVSLIDGTVEFLDCVVPGSL